MSTPFDADGTRRERRWTRRDVVRTGAGLAGAAALAGRLPAAGRAQGDVPFLSTQFSPVEEAEAMRSILEGAPSPVEFITSEDGPFSDRVVAEAQAGQGTIGLLGALHGGFATFVEQGLLTDLSDLLPQLQGRAFVEQYLELGRFDGQQLSYVPWAQATYIMAARREALEFLPEGVDENALQTTLTYDQLAQWVKAVNEEAGPKFGLPAGAKGLLPRFLQGYAYPSFTGGLNTTFRSPEAVTMWQWRKDARSAGNPQATTYDNMDEPLRSGEVWIAWDHTARIGGALRDLPEEMVAFPAPRGPKGLGFLPVIAGLAIPKNAPDPEASRAVIEYLTRPEVQTTTLREVAWFPAIEAELPGDLEPGVQLGANAVQATTAAEGALPSLLPVGLGAQGDAYSKVFRDAFQQIVLDGDDIQGVLDAQAVNLQTVLDTAQASCWAPDPAGEGICRVG